MRPTINFTVPIATKSASNLREHWRARQRRVKAQRHATTWAAYGRKDKAELEDLHEAPPCTVWLTRVSPRELDDDNLRGALKAVRDELAELLGLKSDRDPRVSWEYDQRKGKPSAVVVEIEPGRRVVTMNYRTGTITSRWVDNLEKSK